MYNIILKSLILIIFIVWCIFGMTYAFEVTLEEKKFKNILLVRVLNIISLPFILFLCMISKVGDISEKLINKLEE